MSSTKNILNKHFVYLLRQFFNVCSSGILRCGRDVMTMGIDAYGHRVPVHVLDVEGITRT